jgi:hypothetical protein
VPERLTQTVERCCQFELPTLVFYQVLAGAPNLVS